MLEDGEGTPNASFVNCDTVSATAPYVPMGNIIETEGKYETSC